METNPYIDKRGLFYRYGEFFPSELSYVPYNESIAQEYYPLNKEEAIKNGFEWKDNEIRSYNITIETQKIPDNIKDVNDSIMEQILACSHKQNCTHQCTQAFKIIPNELQFYRKMKIPLPILCPNCRHFERLERRNPMKLWSRNCAKCKKKLCLHILLILLKLFTAKNVINKKFIRLIFLAPSAKEKRFLTPFFTLFHLVHCFEVGT